MELSRLKELVGDGKIAAVTFIKRTNGEERRMICRTGVKKGVTGRGAAYDPNTKNLLTVYDMEKQAFRTIPAENVVEIHARKQTHSFRG
jgi:hypothetical protein